MRLAAQLLVIRNSQLGGWAPERGMLGGNLHVHQKGGHSEYFFNRGW